ncbi:hypothetical protein EZI54_01080 [Marinobacter halodurans]|uniref:Uncharacterized protein n=1 Tax=Marinobacter halodurans TaxID=2528979 RepID=A0ABY1ZR27_9GAMM|nr:hypothetical protein [Marinobacter halodurans]TBW59577.1 hypothetical protein EZI54_01080 [Marinobacter halodurans]
MEISRSNPYGLTALDRRKSGQQQRTPDAQNIAPTPQNRPLDRRTRPDRRRRQEAFEGPDRRKRRSGRRRPSLLDARTARPTSAEDRRGERLDTSA